MTPELTKSQVIQDQLADLNETLEKEKVQLTPEVEEYVREHVRALQDKLQAGQDVYESDLEFIEKVKLWVWMPKEWREKYPNIDEMLKSEKMKDVTMLGAYEASKRNISPKQWLDLLYIAESAGKSKKWIDETFKFPGEGKIHVEEDLSLMDCKSLTSLPERISFGGSLWLTSCKYLTSLPDDMTVKGSLYLASCDSLTSLPKGLKVGGELFLSDIDGISSIPDDLMVGKNLDISRCEKLTKLPNGLKVKGKLNLSNCTSLTLLPEGLDVGGDLNLGNCTNLIKLPEGLKVGGSLDLYKCANLISLPNGLKLGRNLGLGGCDSLTSLPNGLEVTNLDIRSCPKLTSLPEDLIVRGTLYLSERRPFKEDVKRLYLQGKIGEVNYCP